LNFPLFNKKSLLFGSELYILEHFRVNLLILITSWSKFGGFGRFWKIQEIQDGGSKMAAV